ncbi:TetR/AcrR family transcriptional regulator [Gordonibacter sp. 28C]|uniref:TetR/AcrR family transcriptional regulator n=1 Tax=Gordonibacter sp. 28C TaxID=2078569 RepID=UPI000DF73C11|nr:TetR/AcrR family transcriptional regulator [Gordonibacter sp. 28C]RDB61247.1 TetR/AcrR family transcriptional regulator [Gordonibacter sp. 28C]
MTEKTNGAAASGRASATRERIVAAAFALFAERGYHAVPVRDIAAAVGIKDASLYNHFPGKRAIFDAVVAEALARTRDVFESQGVMVEPTDDPTGYAGSFEETERRVLAGFRHFFADDEMIRLRRFLTMSQFDDGCAASAYRLVFIEQPTAIQRTVFEHLMACGRFALDDAQALAREFHGPVFLLLASGASWAEAEPLVRAHLRRFFDMHAIKASEDAATEGEER